MDHSFFPHVLQTLPNVQHYGTNLLVGEARSLLDAVVQVALPTQLGHNIAISLGKQGFDEAEDVGMPEQLQNPDLFEDKFLEVLVFELVKGNHLDGHYFFCV